LVLAHNLCFWRGFFLLIILNEIEDGERIEMDCFICLMVFAKSSGFFPVDDGLGLFQLDELLFQG
jgi:hypothetical protein